MPGSSVSSGFSRTSFRGRWTWPPDFARPASQWRSAGFTSRGCLAMLPDLPHDLEAARQAGITLFAGEAEGRLEGLFADALAGRLRSTITWTICRPAAAGDPVFADGIVRRYGQTLGAFDAGRGCPFQCSFCTIINVQGRKSRWRDADDVERLVRANLAQGVFRSFSSPTTISRATATGRQSSTA